MRDGLRIALLISGGGTTTEAILKACALGKLKNVVPVCVIASKPGIPGMERAQNAGVDPQNIIVLKPADFSSREAFGEAIITECKKRSVDFIGQYGWHPKTPTNVVEAYKGMIVNQHPGPLDYPRPDFGGKGMYGRRVHCARMLFVREVNRDFWSEATAHRVTEGLDQGSVLARRAVAIETADDVETFRSRMLPVEHAVQIETIRDFVGGTVKEVTRDEPLVRPGEEPILEAAKRAAGFLYPQG